MVDIILSKCNSQILSTNKLYNNQIVLIRDMKKLPLINNQLPSDGEYCSAHKLNCKLFESFPEPSLIGDHNNSQKNGSLRLWALSKKAISLFDSPLTRISDKKCFVKFNFLFQNKSNFHRSPSVFISIAEILIWFALSGSEADWPYILLIQSFKISSCICTLHNIHDSNLFWSLSYFIRVPFMPALL